MNCPRDHSPLDPKTFRSGIVHRCGECQGLWMDQETILELFHRLHVRPPALPRWRTADAFPASRLVCPRDRLPMSLVQQAEVEIDVCATCRGVWLDQGELKRIASLGKREPEGKLGDVRDAIETIGEGIVFVLQILAEAWSSFH